MFYNAMRFVWFDQKEVVVGHRKSGRGWLSGRDTRAFGVDDRTVCNIEGRKEKIRAADPTCAE